MYQKERNNQYIIRCSGLIVAASPESKDLETIQTMNLLSKRGCGSQDSAALNFQEIADGITVPSNAANSSACLSRSNECPFSQSPTGDAQFLRRSWDERGENWQSQKPTSNYYHMKLPNAVLENFQLGILKERDWA